MKIAIVGAGPRGLLVTAWLIKNFSHSQVDNLQIKLFDRYPVGGRVWQTKQYRFLKMDTLSQQITMFPLASGDPNLYQWIHNDAVDYIKKQHFPREKLFIQLAEQQDPNYYAPRCMFGLYLKWFYEQLINNLPKSITVDKINHFVYNVKPQNNGGYQVSTEDGESYNVDKVVMNLGQQVNKPSGSELRLGIYAHQNQLLYYPIGYVEEKNINLIEPKQPIIVRGLGLNFMDTMNVLTLGRGGQYRTKRNGQLVYKPSGREPHIIAGSRRGLPYYCKAVNQKPNAHHPQPYFLSSKVVKQHLNNSKLSYSEFIHLIKLDMERIYYSRLIDLKYPKYNAKDFQRKFTRASDPQQVIDSYHFKKKEIFSLHKMVDPINYKHIHSVKKYQKVVIKWLNNVIKAALTGNVKDPTTAAISTLRDSRDAIRWIVNNDLFTNDDYFHNYLSKFNSLNSLLVMGPPVTDMNRLRALMKAGVVTVLPKDMVVKSGDECFIVYSKAFPHHIFGAQMMMEARNPVPKTSLSISPLTKHLYDQGMIENPSYKLADGQTVKLDSVNVKPDSDQVIDKQGHVQPDLYSWGLSTEGIHWCTPNAPHPSGHDSNLRGSERIAKDLLGISHPKFNLM